MTRPVGLLGVFRRKRGQNQFAQRFAGFARTDVFRDSRVFGDVEAKLKTNRSALAFRFRLASASISANVRLGAEGGDRFVASRGKLGVGVGEASRQSVGHRVFNDRIRLFHRYVLNVF